MRETSEKARRAHQKRILYIKVIYLLGLIFSLIYILRFSFEFKVPQYNDVLVPTWVALVVLPPLFYYYVKSYRATAIAICVLESFLLIYLLYLSGGVDAPGIFWLATIPLVAVIALGYSGGLFAYLTIFIVIGLFWYFKLHSIGPNVVALYGNYAFEKAFNLCTFLVFSAVTTNHFIRGEQRFAQKLEEKNVDVENLLRVLIHDIANTLSSMTYNLVKAREDGETATPHELEKIEKAVDDINELLAQVRHLKAVKDGKTEMFLKTVSLPIVLNEVYDKVEGLAVKKGVKISLDLSREKMLIQSERTILGNVILMNLINNAVKFSHPGMKIDLRAYSDASHAVIEIQDYGIGIPQEILPQLFNLGSHTSREGTQGEKGTGYGMPLAKEYLQMMGGSIEVLSSEVESQGKPRGTKVTLKLPLARGTP